MEQNAAKNPNCNQTFCSLVLKSIDNLSEVVKMSEKIGEVIVKGLKRGENITERKTVKIQSSNLGEILWNTGIPLFLPCSRCPRWTSHMR